MNAIAILALTLSLAAASPQEPEIGRISEDQVEKELEQIKSIQHEVMVEPETSAEPQRNSVEPVYDAVEQQAAFPGGQAALMRWISANLIYPVAAQENGVQGRVIVRFVVEKDGTVTNPMVVRSVDPDLDKEALRLVKKMPRWQPGKLNGVVVRSNFYLPVTFKLQDK